MDHFRLFFFFFVSLSAIYTLFNPSANGAQYRSYNRTHIFSIPHGAYYRRCYDNCNLLEFEGFP